MIGGGGRWSWEFRESPLCRASAARRLSRRSVLRSTVSELTDGLKEPDGKLLNVAAAEPSGRDSAEPLHVLVEFGWFIPLVMISIALRLMSRRALSSNKCADRSRKTYPLQTL
jgi:hypothetical protein